MRRSALLSVVVVVVVVFVASPSAVAKLPMGTSFEACGESGCRTTAGEDVYEGGFRLLEPTNEHGDAGAAEGSAAWTMVDIGFPDRGKPGSPAWLREIEREFPVIFVPGADTLGLPRKSSDEYRWVPVRPAAAMAYAQVTEGVQPFQAQVLAELDRVAVARAGTAGTSGSADDGGEPQPGPAIAVMAAVAVVLAAVARRAT